MVKHAGRNVLMLSQKRTKKKYLKNFGTWQILIYKEHLLLPMCQWLIKREQGCGNTCKTARRKKELTRAYFLNNAATKTLIPVCQKFFLNTLAVDEKEYVQLLQKKQRLEQSKLILLGSTIITLIVRRGRKMSWTTYNFLKLLNHIM